MKVMIGGRDRQLLFWGMTDWRFFNSRFPAYESSAFSRFSTEDEKHALKGPPRTSARSRD